MRVLKPSDMLTPYPEGWYVLDVEHQLAVGEVKSAQFVGRDIVYYRTEGGSVVALDAHCPHMGAHLGHGGRVIGETIQCPFHHFRFDTSGSCAHVPGLQRCPPLRTRRYETLCAWGYVMIYHHPHDEAPRWRPPAFIDMNEWTRPEFRTVTMNVHPADVAENGADLSHFNALHHNTFVMEHYGAADENTFRVRYRGLILSENPIETRIQNLLGDAVVDATLFGVGLLNAHINIPGAGVWLHFTTSPRPATPDATVVQVGFSMKQELDVANSKLGRSWPFSTIKRALPIGRFARMLVRFASDFIFASQFEDAPIWANKVYYRRPKVVEPSVQAYRRWASRFAPPLEPDDEPARRVEGVSSASAEGTIHRALT